MLSKNDFKEKQIACVFLNQGEKLSFSNDNLVLKDIDGKIKLQTTCYRLFALLVIGSFTMTSGLIQRSKKFGFTIILLSHSFRPYACIPNGIQGNTQLRKAQYAYEGIDVAKCLVINKIENQALAIGRIKSSKSLCDETRTQLSDYAQSVKQNKELSVKSLLGLEGSASRQYFAQMFRPFEWKGRKPRLKLDPCNSLLDLGYSLLFSFIECLAYCYDFDIYHGVYHREFYLRKSLVCDLIEPFRPIVDLAVRDLLLSGKIKQEHFFISNTQYRLDYKKSKDVIGPLLNAILLRKEEIFLFMQRYYRYFMRINEGREYAPFEL